MKREKDRIVLQWMSHVAGLKQIYIGVLLLIQILLGVSGVFFALFLSYMIDGASAGKRDVFLRYALAFVGLVAVQIALRAIARFLTEYTKVSLENRFKERLFSALLTKDFESVNGVHTGEWLNRLTSDVTVVTGGMVEILPGLSGMVVKLAAAVVMLLVLEPRFGYFLIPGGIFLLLFTYAFRRKLKRMHKRIQETDGEVRILFQEYLESLLVVRSYGMEDMAREEARGKMKTFKKAVLQRNHFSNLCNIGFGIIMHGAYVAGAIFCGYGILSRTMTYGTFTAVLQLIGQVQTPFANLTGFFPRYYAMLASAERLMDAEFLPDKEVSEILDAKEVHRRYHEELTGLGLSHAGFTYRTIVRLSEEGETAGRETVVLKDINLEIRKGDYVAFTGPSGCGKSTALKLFLGLYPLDEGERYLRFDGGREPLDSSWQKLFAYVPQGNHLMSGTIREVVAFSDKEQMKDEARIERALTIACAKEFVDELEQGVDTSLGERGAGLSEGQMQRLAIARAVFSEHPILMMDESTSALDEMTEKQLLTNLHSMTDKTVLIVTHRPAALDICDKIVKFSEDGVQILENKACKLSQDVVE